MESNGALIILGERAKRAASRTPPSLGIEYALLSTGDAVDEKTFSIQGAA
jgi:hypothetical protein